MALGDGCLRGLCLGSLVSLSLNTQPPAMQCTAGLNSEVSGRRRRRQMHETSGVLRRCVAE
jgi:hypothetical protein